MDTARVPPTCEMLSIRYCLGRIRCTTLKVKDDHPIGLLYDTALANPNATLFDPGTTSVTIQAIP